MKEETLLSNHSIFWYRYVHKYNNNKLRRSLVDKLDINRIRKIEHLIEGSKLKGDNFRMKGSFIPGVDSEVGYFRFADIMKEYGDLSRAEKLRRWLKDIENVKNEIGDNIYAVLQELDCQRQSIEALRQQVLKNESKR